MLDCERWNFIIHHVNPVNSCNNSNSVSDGLQVIVITTVIDYKLLVVISMTTTTPASHTVTFTDTQ